MKYYCLILVSHPQKHLIDNFEIVNIQHFSAIAIQVGSSSATSWQIYLLQEGDHAGQEVDVYKDNTRVTGNSENVPGEVQFTRFGKY